MVANTPAAGTDVAMETEPASGGPVIDPNAPVELFCHCQKPETMDMIACDGCDNWFHAHCFGIDLVSTADAWTRCSSREQIFANQE